MNIVRDNTWLANRIEILWENHFQDVPQGYPILTRFGTRAHRRFGCIMCRDSRAVIVINRLFALPEVPQYVVDATLAHELAHYAHGYGSGLPKKHSHPHRGGVVDQELENRGLGEVMRLADAWHNANWENLYRSACNDLLSRREAREQTINLRWNSILCRQDCRSLAEIDRRFERIYRQLELPKVDIQIQFEWLSATTRQNSLSYWFAEESTVRLHGLLALPRVPESVIDFELAYWAGRIVLGRDWPAIEKLILRSGMSKTMEEAIRWRKRSWTAFRRRNHPLFAKTEMADKLVKA